MLSDVAALPLFISASCFTSLVDSLLLLIVRGTFESRKAVENTNSGSITKLKPAEDGIREGALGLGLGGQV